MFRLRFSKRLIRSLSEEYERELSNSDRDLTTQVEDLVFPSYRRRRYLKKSEFLTVCRWKTARSKSRCERDSPGLIKEISEIVLCARSERLRIEILTLLQGVGWPTASVFLHFAFRDRYPFLDYRALWSLNVEEPPVYGLDFWKRYADFCRDLARSASVSMRTVDQALWKYSEKHQAR